MFSLICAWINRWVYNGEAGDLRRYRAHYDVIVMDRIFAWDFTNDTYKQYNRLTPTSHWLILFDIEARIFRQYWLNNMATDGSAFVSPGD